jgi:hypothetical protein
VKQLKKASENGAVKRFYYHCAISTCNTKRTKTIHIIQGQTTITTNEVNGVHNHPPPPPPPINSEIRQATKQMLSDRMNLSFYGL